MRASSRTGAVAMALLFTSACVDRFTIPPSQLEYLNGYDIHMEQTVNGTTFTDRPYRLLTDQGQLVDYNSTKQLYLVGATGKLLAPSGPYQGIYINQGSFDVLPFAGPPIQVPLETIKTVQLEQYSREKTNELISGLSLVVSVALVALSAVAATSHSSVSVSNVRTAPPFAPAPSR